MLDYAKIILQNQQIADKNYLSTINKKMKQQQQKNNNNAKMISNSQQFKKTKEESINSTQNLNLTLTNLISTPTELTAESNILKAITFQKSDYEELHQFLSSIDLVNYEKTFIDNGFDDYEVIKELNEEYLTQMLIPKKAQQKILTKIHDNNNSNTRPSSTAISDRQQVSQFGTNTETIKENLSRAKVTETNDLGTGTFDENESHQQFLQALNEYRNAKKSQPKSGKPKVQFNEQVQYQEIDSRTGEIQKQQKLQLKSSEQNNRDLQSFKKKKTALDEIEEYKNESIPEGFIYGNSASWNNFVFESQTDEAVQMDPDDENQNLEKYTCWTCFSAVFEGQAYREFCSQTCVQQYQKCFQIQCQYCQKNFFKPTGIFESNKWFCNDYCYQEHENNIQSKWEIDNHEELKYNKAAQKLKKQTEFNELNQRKEQQTIMTGIKEFENNFEVKLLNFDELEEKYSKLTEVFLQ